MGAHLILGTRLRLTRSQIVKFHLHYSKIALFSLTIFIIEAHLIFRTKLDLTGSKKPYFSDSNSSNEICITQLSNVLIFIEIEAHLILGNKLGLKSGRGLSMFAGIFFDWFRESFLKKTVNGFGWFCYECWWFRVVSFCFGSFQGPPCFSIYQF